MDLYQFASGVAQIAEFQMADLIRKVTIRKGLDPRDFVLFAFGGAGPVHMGIAARELGVRKVIVPQGDSASVWCAFGAASADTLHVNEQVQIMSTPFEPERINQQLVELKERGRQQLSDDGIVEAKHRYRFSLDMRHRGQINEVEVDIDRDELSADDMDDLRKRFVARYEMLYGKGAALAGARLEIVTFRCRASAPSPKPKLLAETELSGEISSAARKPEREIYWAEWQKLVSTPIYDGYRLRPGNRIDGPCVVETDATAVVVHPGQHLQVDALGNFEMTDQIDK
jgi:N-methylhydantoinase A